MENSIVYSLNAVGTKALENGNANTAVGLLIVYSLYSIALKAMEKGYNISGNIGKNGASISLTVPKQ